MLFLSWLPMKEETIDKIKNKQEKKNKNDKYKKLVVFSNSEVCWVSYALFSFKNVQTCRCMAHSMMYYLLLTNDNQTLMKDNGNWLAGSDRNL